MTASAAKNVGPVKSEAIAETENFALWKSTEVASGEVVYHLELTGVTCHFSEAEWAEFLRLIRRSIKADSP